MHIIHISDLHFGDHNQHLADSLKDRVEIIQPDVIVVTGDLVESPSDSLFLAARDFLRQLWRLCLPPPEADPQRPRIILVPGNHDVRYLGNLRIPSKLYQHWFQDFASNYYFAQEKVWIYGLDSSSEILVGANGRVSENELRNFAKSFADLGRQHGGSFEAALKIVALHHHPLPVKYDDKHQRWLTLVNAGALLGEVLNRKVDLILHGHEHVHARAHYGRELRDGVFHEVPVVSVGAALKRNPGQDRNRFNVVVIQSNGEIRVDSYGAEQNSFEERPWGQSLVVRSPERAKDIAFENWKRSSGYYYRGVASVTILDKDGDGRRIIEYEDLVILNANCERASSHEIQLPQTSGDIDLLKASAIRGNGLIGLRLQSKVSEAGSNVIEATIEYGRRILQNEPISYQYEWWAVNSFVMNERECRCKYGAEPPTLEFTHMPINDPIEELTIVLRFPEDLRLTSRPEPFIAKLHPTGSTVRLEREASIEARMARTRALRYIESLRTATLQVSRPESGYSYGIMWKVPESQSAGRGAKVGKIEEVVQRLLEVHRTVSTAHRDLFMLFFRALAALLRQTLIPDFTDPLEISLMIFDADRRKMVIVGAAMVGDRRDYRWLDYSSVEFDYGQGIGGKAFKANECRLYVKMPETERKTPDFYRVLPGTPAHAVLLAIPLQNPDDENYVYGVINCGSVAAGCPLRAIGGPGGSVQPDRLRELQSSINKVCFCFLTGKLPSG